jgi:hypothetical protein
MRKLTTLLFLACSLLLSAQDQTEAKDSLSVKKEKRLFELSLGHTILFISESEQQNLINKEAVIVPTNSLLFFAEFRPVKRLKIPVFLNIPTQSKQFIVNGQLVSEKASPTFGTGLECRIFKVPINKRSAIEMELGPLASVIVNTSGVLRFAPVVAGRLRFLKNEDFVLYFGGSYSVGINIFGVLFGTGYVF